MRKCLYLSFLLIFCASSQFAQNANTVDSLENLLKVSTGLKRADILINLGWEIKYTNPDQSILHSQEALKLAQSSSYIKGIALSNRNLAATEIIKGNIKGALPFAEISLENIQKTKDFYQKGKILNLLAIINRDLKHFKKSIDYQNQALEVFRKLKDSIEIAGNLNNLGMIYRRMGNSAEALSLYLQVYDLEKKLNNTGGIARTANNLADIYQNLNKPDKAIEMFNISIDAARAVNNQHIEAASIHGLGLFYQDKGEMDNAIKEFNRAIAINRQAGYSDFLANNLMQLAQIYEIQKIYNQSYSYYKEAYDVYTSIYNPWHAALALNGMSIQQRKLKNMPLATELAEKAFKISDSLNDITGLGEIRYNLYQIKKEINAPAEALMHLEAYLNIRDTIQEREKLNLLEEIQSRYEVKTIEDDNRRLRQENLVQQKIIRNNKIITIIIVVAFLIALFLAIQVTRARKKLRSANKELTLQHEEIQKQSELLHASNATKDKLFSIISHDIRNPFSALLNLSEMLNDEVETADKEMLKFYANNIHQSAHNTFQLLDNLLFWSKSQRGTIEISPEVFDLKELVTNVSNTASAGALENKISIHNNIKSGISLKTDKTLLRIILGNLIGNAVKFNKSKGEIIVDASLSGSMATISVKDSGNGIAPDRLAQLFNKEESFQPEGSRAKNGTGLGLILCREFVEKLGGKISVESEIGKGTTFTFTIPAELSGQ